MKTPILFLGLCMTWCSYSQKVYDLDKKEPKTIEQVIGKSVKTNDKATFKGKTYEVYKTDKSGKLFIVAESKKGNLYRKYINDTTL